MGKASSKKKIARAAKAGGGRARAAGERNVVFPTALAAVVVLGTALVVYARDERSAEAQLPPLAFEDHWHSSYGIYVCDEFLPPMPEFTAPQNGGTHTHGDGLLHIHPFSTARSGNNATIANFVSDAGTVLGGGAEVTETTLGVPGDGEYVEGQDACEGVEGDPVVQILYWESAQDALDGADPVVFTENLDQARFEGDGEAFVLAYAPLGAEIGPAPSTADLAEVGTDLGVDPEDIPEEVDPSLVGDGQTDTTDTTVADGDTETTETTVAEDGDATSTTLSDAEARAEEEAEAGS